MTDKLRWGILGTAAIAADLARGIAAGGSGRVHAIASRDLGRARAWAKEHGAAVAFGSYDELLRSGEVDLLYIPLPNSLHAEWTLRALDAGLPVLCEKPFAANAAEARKVADAAARAGLPVIEAFAYRYHPVFDDILRTIAQGLIGDVVSVDSVFTWRLDDRSRIPASAELAGGSLMDVGCYGVNVSRMIAGCEPARVFAFARRTSVDDTMNALMEFPNGVLAHFESSIEAEERRSLEIKGTHGLIALENPWCPSETEAAFILRRGGRDERIATAGGNPYGLEAEDLARCVRTRTPPRFPLSDTIANMTVLDALALSAKTGSPVAIE